MQELMRTLKLGLVTVVLAFGTSGLANDGPKTGPVIPGDESGGGGGGISATPNRTATEQELLDAINKVKPAARFMLNQFMFLKSVDDEGEEEISIDKGSAYLTAYYDKTVKLINESEFMIKTDSQCTANIDGYYQPRPASVIYPKTICFSIPELMRVEVRGGDPDSVLRMINALYMHELVHLLGQGEESEEMAHSVQIFVNMWTPYETSVSPYNYSGYLNNTIDSIETQLSSLVSLLKQPVVTNTELSRFCKWMDNFLDKEINDLNDYNFQEELAWLVNRVGGRASIIQYDICKRSTHVDELFQGKQSINEIELEKNSLYFIKREMQAFGASEEDIERNIEENSQAAAKYASSDVIYSRVSSSDISGLIKEMEALMSKFQEFKLSALKMLD